MGRIPGWFDYAPFWDRAVATAPPGAALVEVGVFCGKSLAHLARIAKAADRGLRVYGVDTFRGSPEHHGAASNLHELPPFTLASLCMEFLDAAGVLDDVTLIRAPSVTAAKVFADDSLHAVFLDADHSEGAVAADIAAWLPKLNRFKTYLGGALTGMFGGDDYHTFPGVKAAVDRCFGPAVVAPPDRCWWELREGGVQG
ncbi:MAG: class I SAM-dependent methyltransferase [Rhizobium sp.]|nr:MAG: class I SAM-dependent methyltransferase [Rhizobium sp.]